MLNSFGIEICFAPNFCRTVPRGIRPAAAGGPLRGDGFPEHEHSEDYGIRPGPDLAVATGRDQRRCDSLF
jgi:hypothetical protein